MKRRALARTLSALPALLLLGPLLSRPAWAEPDYVPPCINLLIKGAIRKSNTPAPLSDQKPTV